jgi:hypothetical protein
MPARANESRAMWFTNQVARCSIAVVAASER